MEQYREPLKQTTVAMTDEERRTMRRRSLMTLPFLLLIMAIAGVMLFWIDRENAGIPTILFACFFFGISLFIGFALLRDYRATTKEVISGTVTAKRRVESEPRRNSESRFELYYLVFGPDEIKIDKASFRRFREGDLIEISRVSGTETVLSQRKISEAYSPRRGMAGISRPDGEYSSPPDGRTASASSATFGMSFESMMSDEDALMMKRACLRSFLVRGTLTLVLGTLVYYGLMLLFVLLFSRIAGLFDEPMVVHRAILMGIMGTVVGLVILLMWPTIRFVQDLWGNEKTVESGRVVEAGAPQWSGQIGQTSQEALAVIEVDHQRIKVAPYLASSLELDEDVEVHRAKRSRLMLSIRVTTLKRGSPAQG